MKKVNILSIIAIFGFFSCESEQKIPEIKYAKDVVSEPIPFAPGVISTEDNSEFELTFSADGLTIYFSRRVPE